MSGLLHRSQSTDHKKPLIDYKKSLTDLNGQEQRQLLLLEKEPFKSVKHQQQIPIHEHLQKKELQFDDQPLKGGNHHYLNHQQELYMHHNQHPKNQNTHKISTTGVQQLSELKHYH